MKCSVLTFESVDEILKCDHAYEPLLQTCVMVLFVLFCFFFGLFKMKFESFFFLSFFFLCRVTLGI